MPAESSRKRFIQSSSSALAAASLATGSADAAMTPAPGSMPMRKFGRHADMISAIGLGGHHLGNAATLGEAKAIVHEAIDSGITFFDNAWEYNDHRSEEWLGAGLRGGYRDKVFLMTKVCTHGRDAALAMQMLEESLRRLGTDRLDLWQAHAITYDNDPELAYRQGGVLEAFDKAKRQGKVRYVGFTGHKSPAIHLDMIERGYAFDAVQMPLNAFDGQFRSFERLVIPEARKRGIAVLGMKPFNGAGDPFHSADIALTPDEALRYAMSLPVATTITGMEALDVLRQNVRIARSFVPMTSTEMAALRVRLADVAADGRFERYKTSLQYDDIVTRQVHGMPLGGAHA
ncbi:MAG: aldo/keto reductase [Candidatus Eremiobacteraeota bacterium]|nr:aldo/keto reductase [Candidatus Eremiobacteraeota bacterium]